MRLLIVSPLLYHPTCGNGGGVICHTLLEGLSKRHSIAFVGFASGDAVDDGIARTALSTLCDDVHVVPLPQASALRRLRLRAAPWWGGPPLEAAAFDSPAMRATLSGVLAAFRPDAALLQFPYMASYVSETAVVPTVMDVQDVFFVSRLREFAAQTARWPRLKRQVAWLSWTRYEMRWYGRCDALMALSDGDRAALGAIVPGVPAFTNPAAIAPRAFVAAPADAAHRVGFGGQFGHPPNLDALRWLNEEVAPALARRNPAIRIVVAGRGIPQALAADLHPSIRLEGFVEDYDRFVRSCAAFVAPLRFGGGVKVKVLEALACGRPVVATPIGAEGIALGAAEGLHVEHTAEGIAARLTDVVQARAAAAEAGARAAVRVADLYGVAGSVQRLENEIARAIAARQAGEQSFKGAAAPALVAATSSAPHTPETVLR